jgi:hypothetical protein
MSSTKSAMNQTGGKSGKSAAAQARAQATATLNMGQVNASPNPEYFADHRSMNQLEELQRQQAELNHQQKELAALQVKQQKNQATHALLLSL